MVDLWVLLYQYLVLRDTTCLSGLHFKSVGVSIQDHARNVDVMHWDWSHVFVINDLGAEV